MAVHLLSRSYHLICPLRFIFLFFHIVLQNKLFFETFIICRPAQPGFNIYLKSNPDPLSCDKTLRANHTAAVHVSDLMSVIPTSLAIKVSSTSLLDPARG